MDSHDGRVNAREGRNFRSVCWKTPQMKKSLTERLKEMADQAENGTLELLPCDEYKTGRSPEELKAAVEDLKHLNETPQRSSRTAKITAVNIRVPKTVYSRLEKKAKQEKVSVPKLIAKLAGEK
jgi:hypothetical protein